MFLKKKFCKLKAGAEAVPKWLIPATRYNKNLKGGAPCLNPHIFKWTFLPIYITAGSGLALGSAKKVCGSKAAYPRKGCGIPGELNVYRWVLVALTQVVEVVAVPSPPPAGRSQTPACSAPGPSSGPAHTTHSDNVRLVELSFHYHRSSQGGHILKQVICVEIFTAMANFNKLKENQQNFSSVFTWRQGCGAARLLGSSGSKFWRLRPRPL